MTFNLTFLVFHHKWWIYCSETLFFCWCCRHARALSCSWHSILHKRVTIRPSDKLGVAHGLVVETSQSVRIPRTEICLSWWCLYSGWNIYSVETIVSDSLLGKDSFPETVTRFHHDLQQSNNTSLCGCRNGIWHIVGSRCNTKKHRPEWNRLRFCCCSTRSRHRRTKVSFLLQHTDQFIYPVVCFCAHPRAELHAEHKRQNLLAWM